MSSSSEQEEPKRIGRPRKYSSDKEHKEVLKEQKKKSYYKLKDKLQQYDCEVCNIKVNYYSKSGHLRSKNHKYNELLQKQ